MRGNRCAYTLLVTSVASCKMLGANGVDMVELLRTNDIVLISRVEALMAEHDIPYFVADQYMSAVEGSLGFLPRRMLIDADDILRARMALHSAGLISELRRG